MKISHINTRCAAFVMALLVFGPAHSAEIRIACDQSDNLDAKMAARYIHTPGRALFDVSFKAPASAGFEAREFLEVRVDGYVVGYAKLAERTGSKLGASLSFDSYANSGYTDDPRISAFPVNWPGSLPPQPIGISAGSRIMIGHLGCTLR